MKYIRDRETYFEAKAAKKADEEEEFLRSMETDIEKKPSQAEKEDTKKPDDIIELAEKIEELKKALDGETANEKENVVPADEPAQRKHILVVDDDPLMLKMLKEHLHGEYDVATAVSGKIALKFLERKKTNLILLDYEMPGEKGPGILEKVRANEATKDIPVIFLTGVSDREKIQEALVLRPQSYLLKPIDREKLIEAITKVIG